MLIKLYGTNSESEKRYSPSHCIGTKKEVISGNPDFAHVSNSYVKQQNLTMWMGMRRFTNAPSKKLENHIRAISLHFMYYNFCRTHSTIKTTPAIKVGIENKKWTLEKIVNMVDEYLDNK